MPTVTIPSDSTELSTLTWKQLQAVRFAADVPFVLPLMSDQAFIAESIVRLIPKKRMVAFGTWLEKPAVAKIFFDTHSAKRHMERDLAGVTILQDHKIPTPALYYQGIAKDKRIHILIFARIDGAKNLEMIWQQKKSVDSVSQLLRAMMIEIATQHVLGVLQQDLHLKNFLITEKTIYTLDGDQIELHPYLLPKKISLQNLALFLSQLGVGLESLQLMLFKHYAKSRGWLLKPEDGTELFLTIKKWNETRWEEYEKKIFRNCSDFAVFKQKQFSGVMDRQYHSEDFMAFLRDPESVFSHPAAKVLKAGRSSTVIKITIGRRLFVIKRYNLKNTWHYLRRCLRPTRASHAWRLAQKFKLFGISTPRPVAFIEKRRFGLRSQSYYVTEYIPGKQMTDFFAQPMMADKKTVMIQKMTALLQNVAKIEVTHGDLKATNILINEDEEPMLIDLDGAREHVSVSSLNSAWRKEVRRFLRNFKDQPDLQMAFKNALYSK